MLPASHKTKWQRPSDPPVIRDFVNFSLLPGCSHADVVQEIAKQCDWRVESMPDELKEKSLTRGRVYFGSAAETLDRIVGNYPNLYWNLSDGVLRFDVRDGRIDLSPFDEMAGRLMREAQRAANGRILRSEYLRITTELEGFKPRDCLEGRDRRALAVWNQTHPRVALHSLSEAYRHPRFHRAVLRRFNRAEAKYRKAHAEE
jgi:hypothetical protein